MGKSFVVIKDLYKTFRSRDGDVEVLKGINLEINKGDIFGIIGFSGAGKSTLIRCINGMETPDSGIIRIGNQIISNLSKKELNKYRQKIGMVFQHFNLFDSRTVFGNVAYPLEIAGYKRNDIKRRVEEILELVELSDKINFYPGQLSGGQKQRVGIARALANNPDLLLSDEATSALDPQTTLSILDLLKEINKKLGLTIILITHELNVIKYICNNMAVLENGVLIEKGPVNNVFLNPTSDTAKLFIKIDESFKNNHWVREGEGI
ncbi:methionine ABC transporter ATP-binding protein [Thermoanaerobacterium thermosaccharolyticum]|uniref:ABC-type metal ion transport system, ATPase component n=1 Tax=Thermoanaerobacterium thermosaccharolyticum M0795 TaxID=698948 RepID=L0ILT9_THETR|nr:ATP-binding cassette domain-containing protein [Thermoanaerobacterium thermosaccharolyticum]AGB19211.1 ABC-type metal ion transport system, ATPase component [Thermoanaerobacterium thermosaccharolyticum M0795]